MRRREDHYAPVTKAWQSVGVMRWQHRRLTEAEARMMVGTLWALAGHPNQGPIRMSRAWLRQGVKRLVHDNSHLVWRKIRPKAMRRRDHCVEQASWERHFTLAAITRGWHEIGPPQEFKRG